MTRNGNKRAARAARMRATASYIGAGVIPEQGNGPWSATKERLRQQIVTYGKTPTVMQNPPAVTINAATQLPGATNTLVDDETKRRVIGNILHKLPFDGTNWGQFLSVTFQNGQPKEQLGGSVERLFTGDAMEIKISGNLALFRIWVDDELVQLAPFQLPGNNEYFVLIDFGAVVTKRIRVDHQYGSQWNGDNVKAGQSATATVVPDPLIFGFVSDSFGETTPNVLNGDAGGHFGIDGWVGRYVHALGVQRYYNSSTGGTSMARPSGGRISGLDRMQADIIDTGVNVLVLAMGINANDVAAETAAFEAAINLYRAAQPAGLLHIITPWDAWAPGDMGEGQVQITEFLLNLPRDGGTLVTDMRGIEFTKAGNGDITHPFGNGFGASPDDGYRTIADPVIAAARAFVGA